jgi:hypothetical protein
MRSFQITLLILILGVASIPCFAKDATPEFPCIGIVTASKLFCRKEPDIKSVEIAKYIFSNPIILINKSKVKQKINNMEDFWYQDKSTKGWLFGGYLFLTNFDEKNFMKFISDRIWCNVGCGGFSCFYEFEPFLIGDYYIAYMYLTDYPQKNDPYAGIIIGKYKIENNSLSFSGPLKIGAYYDTGEWIDDYEKTNMKEYSDFRGAYKKVSDSEGDFFIDVTVKSVLNRKATRSKCTDRNNTEEVFFVAHYLTPIKLADYTKIIPFENFKIK